MQTKQIMALQKICLAALVTLGGTCAWGQTPVVVDGGVLNGASFIKGQAVGPGSLVSIFGSELAAGLSQADSVPLSDRLDGVSVTFNGISAPLLFVSPGQINAQLPWTSLPAGSSSVTGNVVVTRSGVNSTPQNVSIATFAPGVFSIPPGVGYAIAINNSDGSLAAPVGAIQGFPTRPAHPGDFIIVYATGLGPVTPPVVDGHDSMDQLRNTVTKPTVLIGGVAAEVAFSGLTPQFPGVNQLNVRVPNVPAGDKIPIQIEIGGIRTTDQVIMAIQ